MWGFSMLTTLERKEDKVDELRAKLSDALEFDLKDMIRLFQKELSKAELDLARYRKRR